MTSVQPPFETILEHDGAVVTLRASLRAAVAIDNMPGGFPATWKQIARQSLAAMRAVILAAAPDQRDAQRFLMRICDKPLVSFIPQAQAACLAILASYVSNTAEAAESRTPSAEALALRAYFHELYGYATGWLGWTPAETWAASPLEIEAAFTAHADRLVKLTPGLSNPDQPQADQTERYTTERLREIEELGYDPSFDRQGLQSLKAKYS
jgi:hypothetical protein